MSSMAIAQKINLVRAQLQRKNLAAYIIPSSDPHQSEYVATHWETRAWLSGFTGSAGLLIITMDHAGLWTDSRYFLQAETQLKDTPIELHRQGPSRGPEHIHWLADHLPKGSVVALDGLLFSLNQNRSIAKILHAKGLELDIQQDLITTIWPDRPPLPTLPVFAHATHYTGLSRSEKLDLIRRQMTTTDYYLISALDEIAWTFNLRGKDINFNPVFIAYAVIGQEEAYLFINKDKLDKTLKTALTTDFIRLRAYDGIVDFLTTLDTSKKILVDSHTTSIGLYQLIADELAITGDSIVAPLKGNKNLTEIKHIRETMRYDGVALTRLFRWLENTLETGSVSEAELGDQLATFRSQQPGYYGESFPAIVGYQGNGAIVHYRPEHGNSAQIKPEGILLLDSGGQYQSGTTDITRTVALGVPTEEQKNHFTLVLKGHISLARIEFPEGTKGYQIDTLARQYLWKSHLDYGHGTGHGVGFFLNVHEGPQGISTVANGKGSTPLAVGMLTSNEPGYYQPGDYGIRIENLVLTAEAGRSAYGQFLKFETVTLFPIDLKLVEKSLLTKEEIDWLNEYHREVYAKLHPLLEEAEQLWLKKQCQSL